MEKEIVAPQYCDGALYSEVVEKRVWGRSVSWSTGLFGRDPDTGDDWNWSLASLQDEVVEMFPHLLFARHIESVCVQFGIQAFYAPNPTDFNGRVIAHHELRTSIKLGGDVSLRRGVHADGVIVPKGAGFTVSVGGCPVIIATDGETLVAAHAGLESLVRADDCSHVSIVQSIAERFDSRRPYAWIRYAIRPERFVYSPDHPRYGEKNRRLIRWLYALGYDPCVRKGGGIDLPTLIRLQFKRMGILCAETAGEHCYLPEGAYDTACPPPFNRYRNLAVVAVNDIGG